MASNVKGKYIV